MLGTRFERAERLRTQLMGPAEGSSDLIDAAGGDAAAVQLAWASFVPFLAHPAMESPSRSAMGRLDATASAVATRSPVAA